MFLIEQTMFDVLKSNYMFRAVQRYAFLSELPNFSSLFYFKSAIPPSSPLLSFVCGNGQACWKIAENLLEDFEKSSFQKSEILCYIHFYDYYFVFVCLIVDRNYLSLQRLLQVSFCLHDCEKETSKIVYITICWLEI